MTGPPWNHTRDVDNLALPPKQPTYITVMFTHAKYLLAHSKDNVCSVQTHENMKYTTIHIKDLNNAFVVTHRTPPARQPLAVKTFYTKLIRFI